MSYISSTRRSKGKNLISCLPNEILVNIFSRLRVKSLIVCRCVCKPWRTLLRDPIHVKILLDHAIENKDFSLMLREGCRLYSIDYDGTFSSRKQYEAVEIDCPMQSAAYFVRVLGSCNGLICVSTGLDDIYIWNPSTKEYKKVPTPPNEFPGVGAEYINPAAMTYGFGYDCNIEDYKLVRVVGFFRYMYGSEVQVYTLGTDSWKSIQSIPYVFSYGRLPGVLVNGALHWVASPCTKGSRRATVIVSFGIGDERFREVPLPEHLNDDKHHLKNVGVVEGCLYLHHNIRYVRVKVWVMKDYGVKESWTKLFTFDEEMEMVARSFKDLRPIESFNTGKILLEQDNNALVKYDPKNKTATILKIRGLPKWFVTETFVVRSLVSLNSGTYVGQEQIAEALHLKKKRKRIYKKR